MKKLGVLILIVMDFSMFSQNFEKELGEVYKNFMGSNHMSYTIKYILKAGHSESSKIISESNGRYIRDKEISLSEFDNKATLVTPSEIIFVNKEDRLINVKKTGKKISDAPDFVELLRVSNGSALKITRQAERKDYVTYDVILKPNDPSPVERYKITIGTKTSSIKSLTLYYKKGLQKNEDYAVTGNEIPRLDIIFSELNSDDSDKEMQPKYYYTKNNNKLNPTLNFKGYAIKEVF